MIVTMKVAQAGTEFTCNLLKINSLRWRTWVRIWKNGFTVHMEERGWTPTKAITDKRMKRRHVIKKDGVMTRILWTWLKNRIEIVLYVNTVNNKKINFTQQQLLCVWILLCYPLIKTHTTIVTSSKYCYAHCSSHNAQPKKPNLTFWHKCMRYITEDTRVPHSMAVLCFLHHISAPPPPCCWIGRARYSTLCQPTYQSYKHESKEKWKSKVVQLDHQNEIQIPLDDSKLSSKT
jgi:hypothetical protein